MVEPQREELEEDSHLVPNKEKFSAACQHSIVLTPP